MNAYADYMRLQLAVQARLREAGRRALARHQGGSVSEWRERLDGTGCWPPELEQAEDDQVVLAPEQLAAVADQVRAGARSAEDLLVLTQVWGAGGDGRTMYRIGQVLSEATVGSLATAVEQADVDIQAGQPGQAYQLYKTIKHLGSEHWSKVLWVLGQRYREDEILRPLILDERHWATLDAAQWSSQQAAGSIRWAARYEAYLALATGLAQQLGRSPDEVEWALSELDGKLPITA